jgi:hypothetical protein
MYENDGITFAFVGKVNVGVTYCREHLQPRYLGEFVVEDACPTRYVTMHRFDCILVSRTVNSR